MTIRTNDTLSGTASMKIILILLTSILLLQCGTKNFSKSPSKKTQKNLPALELSNSNKNSQSKSSNLNALNLDVLKDEQTAKTDENLPQSKLIKKEDTLPENFWIVGT